MPKSQLQFEELRKRAMDKGRRDEFIQVHNEIVIALHDLVQAFEKGELLFRTRKAGGEVRHWVHKFISVCYVAFRREQVGLILNYQPVPSSWPE